MNRFEIIISWMERFTEIINKTSNKNSTRTYFFNKIHPFFKSSLLIFFMGNLYEAVIHICRILKFWNKETVCFIAQKKKKWKDLAYLWKILDRFLLFISSDNRRIFGKTWHICLQIEDILNTVEKYFDRQNTIKAKYWWSRGFVLKFIVLQSPKKFTEYRFENKFYARYLFHTIISVDTVTNAMYRTKYF